MPKKVKVNRSPRVPTQKEAKSVSVRKSPVYKSKKQLNNLGFNPLGFKSNISKKKLRTLYRMGKRILSASQALQSRLKGQSRVISTVAKQGPIKPGS